MPLQELSQRLEPAARGAHHEIQGGSFSRAHSRQQSARRVAEGGRR